MLILGLGALSPPQCGGLEAADRRGIDAPAVWSLLQPFGALEFRQLSVEGAEGKGATLPRHLEHEAVREAHGRPAAELLESRGNDVRIVHRQVTVVQQHLDGPRLGGRIAFVDRLEDPDRFDQHDVRDPGTARDGVENSASCSSRELDCPTRRTTILSPSSSHSSVDPGPTPSFRRTAAGTEIAVKPRL